MYAYSQIIYKRWKIQRSSKHVFWMFTLAAAKVCSRCQGKIENLKVLAPLLTQRLYCFSIREDWTNEFLLFTSFRKLGWKPELCALKLTYFKNFEKKMKTDPKIAFLNSSKISALSEEISVDSLLWKFSSSALLVNWYAWTSYTRNEESP